HEVVVAVDEDPQLRPTRQHELAVVDAGPVDQRQVHPTALELAQLQTPLFGHFATSFLVRHHSDRPARGGPEWAIWPVLSERLNAPRHGDVGTDVRVLPRLAHGLEAGPPVELDGRQSGVAPQQAAAVTADMSEHGIEHKRADAL